MFMVRLESFVLRFVCSKLVSVWMVGLISFVSHKVLKDAKMLHGVTKRSRKRCDVSGLGIGRQDKVFKSRTGFGKERDFAQGCNSK